MLAMRPTSAGARDTALTPNVRIGAYRNVASTARAVLAGRSAHDFQADYLARIRAQFRWARAVEATFRYGPIRTFGVNAVSLAPAIVGLIANMTRMRGVAGLTAEAATV